MFALGIVIGAAALVVVLVWFFSRDWRRPSGPSPRSYRSRHRDDHFVDQAYILTLMNADSYDNFGASSSSSSGGGGKNGSIFDLDFD